MPIELEKTEQPQLENADLLKALFILIRLVGKGNAVGIPDEKFKNFPHNTELKIGYDKDVKNWIFEAHVPRKKGEILTPDRRVIGG